MEPKLCRSHESESGEKDVSKKIIAIKRKKKRLRNDSLLHMK